MWASTKDLIPGGGAMKWKSLFAAAMVLSFSFGAAYAFQSQLRKFPGSSVTAEHSSDLLQGGFDREGCELDCRSRWDAWFGTPRGGQGRMYWRCLENCDRKFWREYDRDIRDLEKEKP